ncbi:MAG: putative DNA binding domain-containing protein, partial [Ignavibacteriae bacterium]|nr:putative DNA binding domain-containing protein [Ignavibacteriota bacterium]
PAKPAFNTGFPTLFNTLYSLSFFCWPIVFTTKLSNWSILNLFEETRKYDCILIDAHTDSDKGIFNTIPHGRLRAACFSSDQLHGICYNNERQKDNIDSLINTAPDYRRNSPLAYLKCSDAHRVEDVGLNKTWIKMDNLNFKSLRDAFKNPIERISTVEPKINKILTKIVNLDNTFGIPDISSDNLEYFKKLICAFNNSSGGYCLFGLTKEKNKIGIKIQMEKKKEDEFRTDLVEKLKVIFKCFSDIEGYNHLLELDLRNNFNIYPIENDKYIISILIKKSDHILNIKLNKIIYGIKNKNIIELSGRQIQEIIEERQVTNIGKKLFLKIKKIESECILIKNYLSSIPILKKFENNHVNLLNIIEPPGILEEQKLSKTNLLKYSELSDDYYNGLSEGNFVLFPEKFPPRLVYAYLRYSLPVLKINFKKKLKKKETIYLVEGGAVHLSKYLIFKCPQNSLFCLYFSSKNKIEYSNKFISSFLKSSFWMWYCINVFEKTDFSEEIKEIILPKLNIKNPVVKKSLTNLEMYFDKIIKAERIFLKNIEKLVKSKKIDEPKLYETKLNKVEEHNKTVSSLCYSIDKIIYSILGLSQNEINTIETCLRENNIYIHSKGNY